MNQVPNNFNQQPPVYTYQPNPSVQALYDSVGRLAQSIADCIPTMMQAKLNKRMWNTGDFGYIDKTTGEFISRRK